MAQGTVTVERRGVGFLGLLFIAFLVLKLTGFISWSWWWVTAPLWGGMAFFVVILAGLLTFVVVGYAWERFTLWRKKKG